MNTVKIKSTLVSDSRIEYELTITGEWKKYFTDKCFYVEYSQPIKDVNESISVIPVLGTILPISWLFDAQVYVDAIDEDFYNSIPEFEKGYINMYPQLDFGGHISADKVIKNKACSDKAASLFSGGVDAFDTLFSHMNEKPDLITIWGADVADDNDAGWQVVKEYRDSVLKLLDLNGVIIKSSLRKSINEAELSKYSIENANDNWWHGFHHGLGMFALTAPVAYTNGYCRLYVASSFTAEYIGQYTAASDPTIDNYVRFCGCRVVHDGYEFNRQDKIYNICKYSREHDIKIPLRVCWESIDGSNCCKCEKCFRTILGIYAEKENPADFGFAEWEESCLLSEKLIKNSERVGMRYSGIQKRLRENYSPNQIPESIRWIYSCDIHKLEKQIAFKRKLIKIYMNSPDVLKKLYVKMRGVFNANNHTR